MGVSEARPSTNPKDSNDTKPKAQLKATGRNPKDSITYLKLDPIPGFGDHERPKSRHKVEQPTPTSLNFPLPRERPSAFVDILDAQGEIKPSNFKSRIQASGTRDYGEDVADRNMVETSASQRPRAVYSSLSGSSLTYRPHGSVSTASSSKHVFRGKQSLSIPEPTLFLQQDSMAVRLPGRLLSEAALGPGGELALQWKAFSQPMSFMTIALNQGCPTAKYL